MEESSRFRLGDIRGGGGGDIEGILKGGLRGVDSNIANRLPGQCLSCLLWVVLVHGMLFAVEERWWRGNAEVVVMQGQPRSPARKFAAERASAKFDVM